MTRILTVLTPRVRKMHFRVRCINLHIKCPSFSSRYLAACVVSLRQLWGGKAESPVWVKKGVRTVIPLPPSYLGHDWRDDADRYQACLRPC